VDARLVPDGELAQRHPREVFQTRPVESVVDPLDDVQSVETVLGADERGDEQTLADGVGEVDEFDGEVANNQKVAVLPAADQQTDLGGDLLDLLRAAGAEVPLRDHVAVHLIDDVSDSLLAHLSITTTTK